MNSRKISVVWTGEVHFFFIFSGGGGHAKIVCLRL